MLLIVEHDRAQAAKQARREALARVASEEEAAYRRAAHPKHEGKWFNKIWHNAASLKA